MVASPEIRVAINSDPDIVTARQKGRARAVELGFSSGDATLIATAISELARNIVAYAKKGLITLQVVNGSNRQGISVTAKRRPKLRRWQLPFLMPVSTNQLFPWWNSVTSDFGQLGALF